MGETITIEDCPHGCEPWTRESRANGYLVYCEHFKTGWYITNWGAAREWNELIVAYRLAHAMDANREPDKRERADALNMLAEFLGEGATGDLVRDIQIVIDMYESEAQNSNALREHHKDLLHRYTEANDNQQFTIRFLRMVNDQLGQKNKELRAELSATRQERDKWKQAYEDDC